MLTITDSKNSLTDSYDVAVVGAGTAGCLAASILAESGFTVCMIEKSRGVGGRASRRKLAAGVVDLGAPGFSDERLLRGTQQAQLWRERLQHWSEQGCVARWSFAVGHFGEGSKPSNEERLCGAPSMNFLHRHLTATIPVMSCSRVVRLERENTDWILLGEQGALFAKARQIIITAPAQQTRPLFDWPGPWLPVMDNAVRQTQAQWVAVLHFSTAQPQLADVYRGEHPVLAEAIRDSSKPFRRHEGEYWVLHSTFNWADDHLHAQPEHVAQSMKQAFLGSVGGVADPAVVSCHRWLLAQQRCASEDPGYLWSQQLNIGICADWLMGGGIDGALMSAQQLVSAQIIKTGSKEKSDE
ncbi:FAD-dependent oxidoreductase [Ketobacter sp. MCCC 1A13808]|uniref:NAD(P)/FAD-dependent oxidoreductase n=1 Tax=Ketobacter sp. MCCC 1A13808 TaxID=2602738 RepID=UPI000F176348|nr:FAD-dependent oxidoreductase [Ketobacter sp. MCCC 1A13808]MVF11834.1 FAD-dependent oxidoreductase [Ketobacter sp. MCCC 1A13808]RLP55435.1 MAG: FAD-dependent oxidoreductase [Ketobacter sp.]